MIMNHLADRTSIIFALLAAFFWLLSALIKGNHRRNRYEQKVPLGCSLSKKHKTLQVLFAIKK
jgi:hypothetical protein